MKRLQHIIWNIVKNSGEQGSYGGLYLAASVLGNLFGFIYNAFLIRSISVEEFGLISLFSSIVYIIQVFTIPLSKTVTHMSAYILGKSGTNAHKYWEKIRISVYPIVLITTLLWLVALPVLMKLFSVHSALPFLLFTPSFFAITLTSVDNGYIAGSVKFGYVAGILFLESASKLFWAYVLVRIGLSTYIYAALPLSILTALCATWYVAYTLNSHRKRQSGVSHDQFPKTFYIFTIISKLASLPFLSLDLILVKALMSPIDAGTYAVVSLIGKMIYLFSSLGSTFLTPVVSKRLGEGVKTGRTFTNMFLRVSILATIGFVVFGLLGFVTVPLLYGPRALAATPYLPLYAVGIFAFALADTITAYNHLKHTYIFSVVSFVCGLALALGILFVHTTIWNIVWVVTTVSYIYFLIVTVLHTKPTVVATLNQILGDLVGVFVRNNLSVESSDKLRILLFNWRDIRHSWAGGAEVYVHELAKRWASEGHEVTIFCGNDMKSLRDENIDGVRVIRRGGFFMVYFWACVYYLCRFRGKFDVIIDSENGIPFFSPLFAGIPVYLLIHHVHQEVFTKYLPQPFGSIAKFLEAKVMPFVYKNSEIITISDSTLAAIRQLGLTNAATIVSPGINTHLYKKKRKTIFPSILYLGRLRPYKHVDIAVRAFAKLLEKIPTAHLTIAGSGVSYPSLRRLVNQLEIERYVTFTGKVTEQEKVELLATHWVMVQPSMIEGWGITVIEANASGTVVVASNAPGLRDSVVNGTTGLLAEPLNADSFLYSLYQILSNKKLRLKMQKHAVTWSSRFSWDTSAQVGIHALVRKNEDNFPPLSLDQHLPEQPIHDYLCFNSTKIYFLNSARDYFLPAVSLKC